MNYSKVNDYIENLYASDGKLRKQAFIQATNLKDFIPVVDDDVVRFLEMVIRSARPMRVLEIGTSIGFSTSSISAVLQEYGGRITTIEFDPVVALQARENFQRLGLGETVDLLEGDALEIIPRLQPAFDMVFLDVDKNLYPQLLPECLRLLRSGGMFFAEDVLFPVIDLDPRWHDLIEPIRRFNQLVVECGQLRSTMLPIGDGVLFAIKK